MNPLTDVLPARYRKLLYAAFALAGAVVGVLTIVGVDVQKAPDVLTYLGVVFGLTAASNTGTPAPAESPAEEGQASVELLLLVLTFVGVVLLLFGISLD